MIEKQNEIMAITQEECAEVIQAVSKVMRFGFDTTYKDVSNKSHLEEEIGDLLCMFQLMEEAEMIDWTLVSLHAQRKREKLMKWSNIFKETE
jgi:NTP pyrophosphatase (non-canonical NTP hydrolase)